MFTYIYIEIYIYIFGHYFYTAGRDLHSCISTTRYVLHTTYINVSPNEDFHWMYHYCRLYMTPPASSQQTAPASIHHIAEQNLT